MRIARPRLLVASLAVAVVVSLVGAVVWARTVGREDAVTEAVLTDPLDRSLPTEPGALQANGRPATLPIVDVTAADGAPVSTASFLGGEPLVVNFWFSTCAPCAKELPEFAEVDAELGGDVRFIGVNTIDSVPVMERFAGERGVGYELYRDELAELTDGIGAVNFPVTIFVTSDGTVVDQTGVIDAEGLREKVAELREAEAALA